MIISWARQQAVGREASKLNQTISVMGSGEDLPPHKVPLMGRFYGNSASSSSQAMPSTMKRLNEIEAEIKGYRKDRLPIDEFNAENPNVYQ
ncbi:hypothetical protein [Nitrosospira multiformis]|uniref:hypothetical protein n=1 Tax=Nitrosospira multiformis TaxID=1231 RepID=UPI00115FAF50|nr:hypothetical protein [Nitrosospira multiformis]